MLKKSVSTPGLEKSWYYFLSTDLKSKRHKISVKQTTDTVANFIFTGFRQEATQALQALRITCLGGRLLTLQHAPHG